MAISKQDWMAMAKRLAEIQNLAAIEHQTYIYDSLQFDTKQVTVDTLLNDVKDIKTDPRINRKDLTGIFLKAAIDGQGEGNTTFQVPNFCCSLSDCPKGVFYEKLYGALKEKTMLNKAKK